MEGKKNSVRPAARAKEKSYWAVFFQGGYWAIKRFYAIFMKHTPTANGPRPGLQPRQHGP
jgi:hypothetical protein